LRTRDEIEAFWIDAVCINQDDLDERSAQVMLMGDVYQRCSKVYVCAKKIIDRFIPAILQDWRR
ncbi:hypothetical protein BU25DRAFT_354804, partial [Macroventuria anomochaeta]